MATRLDARLNQEADAKGLSGDARAHWIGGAFNRIRGAEHRSSWRHSDEAKLLSRYYGPIHDVRQRGRSTRPSSAIPGLTVRQQDHVVIRQGKQWYDLPRSEYDSLVRASQEEARRETRTTKQLARDDARERSKLERKLRQAKAEQVRQEKEAAAAKARAERERTRDAKAAEAAARQRERAEARAIAEYNRALAIEERQEERQRRTQERQETAYRAQQERDARKMEREQYQDVIAIIRQGGGIKPSVTRQGTKHDTSEYRALPSTVRNAGGRLTADDAARNISAEIPWLHIDGANALYDYFDRHRTRQMHQRHQRHAA